METAKEYKITVNHFVNTAIKPDKNGNYPIYVQVIANRRNQRLKSVIETRVNSDFDLNNFKSEISMEATEIIRKVRESRQKGEINLKNIAAHGKKRTQLDYNQIREYFIEKFSLELNEKDVNGIIQTIKAARKAIKKRELGETATA